MLTRRRFLGSAALGLLPFPVRAQGLDTARIIVGFPPGGTTDVMARKVADKLRGAYARSVIVDNRPGAGGQLGVVVLKDSPPDGSTLLLTPSSMLSIYPYTFRTLQYKLEDVAPVSLAMHTHHVFSVGPAVPESVKSLKDFFAWAKANPDKAVYGSPGAGSMPHLIGVLLTKASGTEIRHAAYRGSAPGIQDLLGGQIAAFFGPTGDVLTHSKAGKVRVLGTSGKERSAFLPAVPTLGEQGVPVAVREWYAFFLPARASAEAVQRAAAALQPVLAQPEVLDFARQFGLEAQSSTPRELAELLRVDVTEWGGLVKQTGFTADS
jgi:tripartite-type tricarboxylate transporter receptor subunit TctC